MAATHISKGMPLLDRIPNIEHDSFEWLHQEFTTEGIVLGAALSSASGQAAMLDIADAIENLEVVRVTERLGKTPYGDVKATGRLIRKASVQQDGKPRGFVLDGPNSKGVRLVLNFRKFFEADPLEHVHIVKRGVNARLVDVLAASMQMPKEKLIGTLGLARATVQRKSSQQTPLSSEESSRVMGISKLIGQAQAMVEESGATDDFDAATWIANWLDEPLPALGGHRPGEFMDTAEGQAIVAQLLARIQSGSYS